MDPKEDDFDPSLAGTYYAEMVDARARVAELESGIKAALAEIESGCYADAHSTLSSL